ncbi:helix-turn-helix domain-containing protein [Gordonia tangerina]|uniref:Helix-turn-helix transcriptional regulator n=1 Tax=Gordonia tangerina TaxID=2911060 RepID=A0ABS9DP08_9ACTN|nr:helix-turn-helix transcriptional regulator [Gordonia tangerina]MCF3939960.1 helix-turn-helix transcriptional regulator [Gordonia tangerina]
MLATLQVNRTGLAKVRRLTGTTTDKEFAQKIHVDAGTVSRVLTGKSAPGPRFIAGCVEAFGGDCFTDLFVVVPDDEDTAA